MTTTSTRHPVFARVWDRLSRTAEEDVAPFRQELGDGLAGRVLEVGAGNGLSFAHYPASVTHLVATEPEPYLRARAEERAGVAPVPVTVVAAAAEELPFDDDTFDAAVASLVLCTVSDQRRALAELQRVLVPGGTLRFFEHTLDPGLARRQRLVDRTFWPRLAGGCHAARDTVRAITEAGFTVTRLRPSRWPAFPGDPTAPCVIGAARA